MITRQQPLVLLPSTCVHVVCMHVVCVQDEESVLISVRGGACACWCWSVSAAVLVCVCGGKAILVRRETEDKDGKLKILELTKDHKCMIAKERERVTKAGGFIQDNRVNGIMEVLFRRPLPPKNYALSSGQAADELRRGA